jgi:hypothetical protein
MGTRKEDHPCERQAEGGEIEGVPNDHIELRIQVLGF